MSIKVFSAFACTVFLVSSAHGLNDDYIDDPIEQSGDCFEKVHNDFSRRITEQAQKELGVIMENISDAEGKRLNPKDKGAVLKHFSLVLRRSENVAMGSNSFSPADKARIRAFIRSLKNCVHGSD